MYSKWNCPQVRISAALLLAATTVAVVEAGGPFKNPLRTRTSVEQLAEKIDKVEKHIDAYGSIVAKRPDVWGESRLMMHRQEYERQMAAQVDKFNESFQASLNRSDQAFLASSLALQAAISGTSATLTTPTSSTSETEQTTTTTTTKTDPGKPDTVTVLVEDKDGNLVSREVKRTAQGIPQKESAPGFDKVDIQRNKTSVNNNIHGFGAGGVKLEPEILLDQRSRYIQHLHELRRINEGDDIAHHPGYAIDLIRVPVSILPGTKTRVGYGAEITVTANAELGDELLPYVFHKWVMNDLVTHFAIPLTRVLNSAELRSLEEVARAGFEKRDQDNLSWWDDDDFRSASAGKQIANAGTQPKAAPLNKGFLAGAAIYRNPRRTAPKTADHAAEPNCKVTDDEKNDIYREFNDKLKKIVPDTGVDRSKTSRFAFPLSQFAEVYGVGLLARAGWEAYERLGQPQIAGPTPVIHYYDVEGYLKEELQAAYRMLNSNPLLWSSCTPVLSKAIRNREYSTVHNLRTSFSTAVGEGANTTTAAYAWAILVHSALLNDRLIEDMKETAANRGCPCATTEWLPYFEPNPPYEARSAFNQYVQCRWPIHVFAIDPITQDQNIADTFGMRRELQLAMALSFASGRINAQKATQFVRRFEMDLETVSLNRTAVGFSHGDNTFGWRFTPRVQTPDIQGNATVAVRDLLIGGPRRDQLTKDYMLEPGSRECIALVVRPAFIQQVTFDIRSNWFSLTRPGKTSMSMEDTVELSKDIRTLELLGSACVKDAHQYRDGEVYRMLRRVNQLSQELSLQTLRTDVPDEATEGGFEQFDAQNSALSPQLYGWYGVPGIDTTQTTSLFLIGEHFSVQGTRAVVGNKPLASTVTKNTTDQFAGSADALGQDSPLELQSHRVMRLTVPAGARSVTRKNLDGKNAQYVEIRVSTPYGVSQALYVPVVKSEAEVLADAVQKHVNELHMDAFQWGGVLKGNIILCLQDGDVQNAKFANDTAKKPLAIVPSGPLDDAISAKFAEMKAQLAVWLTVKSKDATKASQRIAAGPWPVTLGEDNAINYEFLQMKVSEKLRSLPNGFDPKEIEIQAYIRLPQDNGAITHKLQNTLTLSVIQGKCPECDEKKPAIQDPAATTGLPEAKKPEN